MEERDFESSWNNVATRSMKVARYLPGRSHRMNVRKAWLLSIMMALTLLPFFYSSDSLGCETGEDCEDARILRYGVEENVSRPQHFHILVSVYFTKGSHRLTPGEAGVIDAFLSEWEELCSDTVRLDGYSDTTGNSTSNVKLSTKRIESVKSEILKVSTSTKRFVVRSHGEAPRKKMANARRVDVTLKDCSGGAQ